MNTHEDNKQLDNMLLEELIKTGALTIKQVDPQTCMDITDTKRFKKVDIGTIGNVSAYISQLPNLAGAAAATGLYTVSFPKGITGTLTALQQGGFGSMIRDSSGHIVAHASFFPVTPFAVAYGVFTVLSIATQQFFLTLIFKKLDVINKKLDAIMNFLYGDKKSELLSEIIFIQRAYKNYASIMQHESQRIATIASIQHAESIAMKDILFYLNDLESVAKMDWKNNDENNKQLKSFNENCDNFDAALQLYIVSNILEIYYSMNCDTGMIESLKQELEESVDQCNNHMTKAITSLLTNIENKRGGEARLERKKDIKLQYDELKQKQEKLLEPNRLSNLRGTISKSLNAMSEKQEYVIYNQNVYYCIPDAQ